MAEGMREGGVAGQWKSEEVEADPESGGRERLPEPTVGTGGCYATLCG